MIHEARKEDPALASCTLEINVYIWGSDDVSLSSVEELKDLGITKSTHLSWKSHVKNLVFKGRFSDYCVINEVRRRDQVELSNCMWYLIHLFLLLHTACAIYCALHEGNWLTRALWGQISTASQSLKTPPFRRVLHKPRSRVVDLWVAIMVDLWVCNRISDKFIQIKQERYAQGYSATPKNRLDANKLLQFFIAID